MITTFVVPDDWRPLFLSECKMRLPKTQLTELESGFFQSSQLVTLQISSCLFQAPGFEILSIESIQKGAQNILSYLQSKLGDAEQSWDFIFGVHPTSLLTPRESQRTRLICEAFEQKVKQELPRLHQQRQKRRPDFILWAILLPSGKIAITQMNRKLSSHSSQRAFIESWHLPAARANLVKSEKPPSRAYLKLKEGLSRLDFIPDAKMSAVDLGASPGGWSYEIAQYGSQLLSIDRALLDPKMAQFKNLTFQKGDAQTFRPKKPVDLMVCDVIAFPQQNLDLLLRWLTEKLCSYFFVTLKFKREPDWRWLDQAQVQLLPHCDGLMMRRLESNKNEIMLMGRSAASLGDDFLATKPSL